MSRFSKVQAEALGWAFVHEQKEEVVRQGGILKVVPGSVRAEKYVTEAPHAATLVHEQAETMGKLLERIHAWEQRHPAPESAPEPEPDPPAPAVTHVWDVPMSENPLVPVDEAVTAEQVTVTDADGNPVEEA